MHAGDRLSAICFAIPDQELCRQGGRSDRWRLGHAIENRIGLLDQRLTVLAGFLRRQHELPPGNGKGSGCGIIQGRVRRSRSLCRSGGRVLRCR